MSASPASLMRRIYYVTILLALIAGGAYFAYSYRIGQASDTTTDNTVGGLGKISIPSDFPSDLPVYRDGGDPFVIWSGFHMVGNTKFYTLTYALSFSTLDAVRAFYKRELVAKGWKITSEKQNPNDKFHTDTVATNGDVELKLRIIGNNQVGVSVGIETGSKGNQNGFLPNYSGSGSVLPTDSPTDLPSYPKGAAYEYSTLLSMGSMSPKPGDGWVRSTNVTFVIPQSAVGLEDLKAHYRSRSKELGWKEQANPYAAWLQTNDNSSHTEGQTEFSQNSLAFSKNGSTLTINVLVLSAQKPSEVNTPGVYVVHFQSYGSPKTELIPSFGGSKKTVSPSPQTDAPKQSPDDGWFEPLNLPDFEDLPNGYGYAPAIKKLRTEGVLKGYPDGTFKPGNPVNRAEFVKTIVEALGDEASGKSCFSDVKEEWFSQYVCYAKEHDIIGGYPDGSFGPGRNVNYAEAVKIVMLAFGKMEEGAEGGWERYDKYFNAAKERGYLELIESIAEDDPNTPISRGQMAQLIANLIGADTISMFPIGDDTVETSWEDNPSFPGCPKPTAPVAKSYVKIVSPNGNEKFAWGKAVPITIKTSPDIRAVRLSATDTAGKKFDIAYMGVACDGSYEWNPAKDGRPLDAEMLPWSGTILAEGADAFPNYTVSDASDSSFTIVKP